MAPPSSLQYSASPPEDADDRFPPLARSMTGPAAFQPSRSDPSHLAPEDAIYAASPPRRPSNFGSGGNVNEGLRDLRSRRLRLHEEGSRSRSRRRKRTWKKLLWVKQSCRSTHSTDQGLCMLANWKAIQTLITIPIKPPSSRTCSGTLACSPTNFGRWSPIPPSSSSTSAPSSYSWSVSLGSSRSASAPFPSWDGAASRRSSAGSCGIGGSERRATGVKRRPLPLLGMPGAGALAHGHIVTR